MSLSSRLVLVLVGPTASGKTAVSLHLARLLNAEIISADSRQIYKHLNIGTAKPTVAERAEVPHFFIDELPPDKEFTAGEFGDKGRKIIDAIFHRGHIPLIVGGSGLYIQSLIDGFFEGPGADWEYRKVLDEKIRLGRVSELLADLKKVDPTTAERIDPTKPRRIVRALEVYHTTGKPLSLLQKESQIVTNFTPLFFGLEWNKEELYRRINARCDDMLKNGLLDEIDRLQALGYGPSLNALCTVGYAEGFAYRNGKIAHDVMVRLFKQNSRRYAKRQMTWFRRDARIHWINMQEDAAPHVVAQRIAVTYRAAMMAR